MAYTILEDMYEGKFIKPCTPELALDVGLNLRWEDRRKVEEITGWSAPAVCVSHILIPLMGNAFFLKFPTARLPEWQV